MCRPTYTGWLAYVKAAGFGVLLGTTAEESLASYEPAKGKLSVRGGRSNATKAKCMYKRRDYHEERFEVRQRYNRENKFLEPVESLPEWWSDVEAGMLQA